MRKEHKDIAQELVTLLLRDAKDDTMRGIYERIAPGPDGRIRTVCSPVGTETGRFSHSDTFLEASTNLGNLPKKVAKLDPLYDVRRCLVPSDGRVFLEADLSQAEVWTTAAYAGDTAKLAKLRRGVDLHRELASLIFNIPPEDVAFRERTVGKRANHMLNYGAGWKEFLSKTNVDADLTGVAISAAEAKRSVDAWRDINEKTVRWWDDCWRLVRSGQPLQTCWGRRRHFLSPLVRPTDVAAFLPQSTVADCLNEGLVRWHNRYDSDDKASLVLQIHDAILLDCVEEYVEWAAERVRECLTVPMTINGHDIVIPVDVSVGRVSWAQMEEAT